MNFIIVSKDQIEHRIKDAEEIAKTKVVDWRLEIPGEGDTPIDFVVIFDDGINLTLDIKPIS